MRRPFRARGDHVDLRRLVAAAGAARDPVRVQRGPLAHERRRASRCAGSGRTRRSACATTRRWPRRSQHSLVLAGLAMLLAVPLGTALAIGLQRWRGRGGGRHQRADAAAAGDAGARVRGRPVPAVHVRVRLHRARDDGAGDRAGDVLDLVGRADRARAAGDDRARRRGGGGGPRRAAVGRAAARAAAAARAGDRRVAADRVRAEHRRLRGRAVHGQRRRHDDGADADLLAARAPRRRPR